VPIVALATLRIRAVFALVAGLTSAKWGIAPWAGRYPYAIGVPIPVRCAFRS